MEKIMRDPGRQAFTAILERHRAMSGVRQGTNGRPIYPREPLYRRVNLSRINVPVPGERDATDNMIGVLQYVLLSILAAIGGVVVALASVQ
jgi:hypothetical protein